MNNRFGYIICDNATEEFSSGQYALGRRDVKHSDLESLIHPDGSLFVLANLEFYADVLASRCKNKPSCSGETNYKLEVIDSYARLLKSGMMSDLTIVVGRAKLRVHQCVLAVRSPYFEALFASDHNSGYSEVKNGVLKIDDFAKQPVEGMLSFIYTGEIDDAIVNKCGESLLQLADKYQMDEMKSYMEGKMAASLRVETFVPVALLADSHRCHFLKEACVTFLRNNFDSITSDDVWKELKSGNRASVAAELLEMAHPGR